MKKNFNDALNGVLAAFFLIAAFSACKKEKTTDTGSPAYQIEKSESLVIPVTVDLPYNLPGGNTRVATYYATGVQQYRSQVKPGSSPAILEWAFVGPRAELFDVSNKKRGTHGAGPYWEISANDSVFGQPFAPARTATAPDGKSIDWLLLMPKNGKTPTGLFKDVSYIQRIATSGGKAPATAPASENLFIDVPYTAVYRFTKKN